MINVKLRKIFKKCLLKKKRKLGYLPGVIYDCNKNISIFILKKELVSLLKSKEKKILLKIKKETFYVFIKEIQYCNFHEVIHVDFEKIKEGYNIISVPVKILNLKFSLYNKNKFFLDLIFKNLKVVCNKNILNSIDIDFFFFRKNKSIFINDINLNFGNRFPPYLIEENPMILKFREKKIKNDDD